MVNLYKTQNILFDDCFDGVKARSKEQVFQMIGKNLELKISVKSPAIIKALNKEQDEHGFTVSNGVLICNAQVKNIKHRRTLLMRLDNSVIIDLGNRSEIVDIVVCTVSPEHLGALNLRYLSRLTRMFSDQDLVENLHAVNSEDGLKLLLNDNPLESSSAVA